MTDECIHLLDPATCSICSAPPKAKAKPQLAAKRSTEAVVPKDLGHELVAALIAQADGAWVDSHTLTLGVLADPQVGDLIRTACASGESRHTNPEIHAGNVVGWWSASWTNRKNPYMDRFERQGERERKYRYRTRPTT